MERRNLFARLGKSLAAITVLSAGAITAVFAKPAKTKVKIHPGAVRRNDRGNRV